MKVLDHVAIVAKIAIVVIVASYVHTKFAIVAETPTAIFKEVTRTQSKECRKRAGRHNRQ